MNPKKAMLLVALTFIIPMAAALFVFSYGLFTPGEANKGEFLTSEVILKELNVKQSEQGYWYMIYFLPDSCTDYCENMIYGLHQGYKALGKLQKDVKPVIVRKQHINLPTGMIVENTPLIDLPLAIDHPSWEALSQQHLYLADPFGLLLLRYSGSADKQQIIFSTKDLLADLKRLIKYSRA